MLDEIMQQMPAVVPPRVPVPVQEASPQAVHKGTEKTIPLETLPIGYDRSKNQYVMQQVNYF